MSNHLPREDTQPWYQQFWPWFLIMLPASVVVASLSTWYIAHRHADDLVVDDYYKDGLAINRQLEKKQRAEAKGITASLNVSGEQVLVTLSGETDAHQLKLLLSHPLESDRDFTAVLIRSGQGQYRGRLLQPVAARWHWTLEREEPEGWRLDGSFTASDIGNAGPR